MVTRQIADKPTRSQSCLGLVNSQPSQLAEMYDGKFRVHNHSMGVISSNLYYLRADNI